MPDKLTSLEAGTAILYGGDKVVYVPAELADAFQPGDQLVVLQETGDLLHIPAEAHETANRAVTAATDAFALMGAVTDDEITTFYQAFASALEDDEAFAPIALANDADVEKASAAGRSTTRLVLSETMRKGMIEGLRMWSQAPPGRGQVEESFTHDRWRLDLIRTGLGPVGFVFEGRPNVFADATGVLRSGNTVVFRVGSAALGTARAIVAAALNPALESSGLPIGAVSLVDSPSRAAGWALFGDKRLALAVARGSGTAVSQLGGVARQAGVQVSLHGTGGGWMVASESAEPEVLAAAVYNSLDRKVCNTLNTCCIVSSAAPKLVPAFLDAVDRAGQRRGVVSKLHVAEGDEGWIPESWFEPASISRADGTHSEPKTESIDGEDLGVEWEWEESPEVTLKIVADLDEAISLFNRLSPRLVVSLVSEDQAEHDDFFNRVDSPFVGNGFTRWVDGQYALGRPELGLSNWETGRLMGRSGVLSGDSVYTVRARAIQDDPDLGR